jgi:hypothetical protein
MITDLKNQSNQNKGSKIIAWLTPAVTIGLYGAAVYESMRLGFSTTFNPTVVVWSILLVAILCLAKSQKTFEQLINLLKSLKWFNAVLASCIFLFFPILLFNPGYSFNQSFFSRIFLLWLVSISSALFLKAWFRDKRFFHLILVSLLFSTAGFQAAGFLRDLTTYLFSIAWSEASRFYYASLPFSQTVYGQTTAWSFLHPSRYLLMSIPFAFGNLPLWVHRGWQIFLWISLTFLGCLSIIRRLKLKDRLVAGACIAWCFIFLLQAPVYYHLMVCAILVLIGFDVENTGKSLFFILLASLWAGISRVNWFPLPAALGILLYTLEKPFNEKNNLWNYLRSPLLFGIIGIGASFISQAAYILISGNQEPGLFATSFTSDLLWYRLLPSPTYPPGILTGLLLLIAPLIILLAINYRTVIARLHWLRRLIILGILLVFLLGGLVVSVKIGGGSNLHNLDAFLVLITVFCSYSIFNCIKADQPSGNKATIPSFLAVLLVLVPVCWSVFNWAPFSKLDKPAAFQDLQRLIESVQRVSTSNKKILFISERHLLTFKYIKDNPLIPDYELLTLMEMAISNNQGYLNRFYEDLKTQKYALIVMDKQYVVFKDDSTAFPEENNAWVKLIAVPVQEYYQPITWLRSTDTEIYAPRNLAGIPPQ